MERSEARERIVKKAMDEILVKGYSKVTMDSISSALGMSKKTIYQLFLGKRDLLRTVLNKLQKEIEEGITQRVDAPGWNSWIGGAMFWNTSESNTRGLVKASWKTCTPPNPRSTI
ncbi:MAG: TetR/AcrR family transcriptional regulator, partial [Fibrobacterota bacterium]